MSLQAVPRVSLQQKIKNKISEIANDEELRDELFLKVKHIKARKLASK